MNRRKFLKMGAGFAAAAAVPSVAIAMYKGQPESPKVIAVDPASAEADESTVAIWGVSETGGYMYSDNLSDSLRQALQPMHKFRQFSDLQA